jgi:hypothetical protein
MRARDNPFCAERTDRLAYRPINGSLEQLMADLAQMDYCGAIVGAEGSGKTTLLTDLGRRLTEKRLAVRSVFVSTARPFTKPRREEFFNELKPGEIVLLDGADHLGAIVWRRFKTIILKSARGLVITSHKAGKLATLIECSTNAELFAQLVSELLGDRAYLERDFLGAIFQEHDANIRDCFRHLYDLYAAGGTSLVACDR